LLPLEKHTLCGIPEGMPVKFTISSATALTSKDRDSKRLKFTPIPHRFATGLDGTMALIDKAPESDKAI
jgi:hypothetical protein